MEIVVIIVGAVTALLYLGQLVSVLDFPRAQRLGLQESAETADPLIRPLETRAAQWDLFVLWLAPLATLLVITGSALWPAAALVAGGVLVDTGGREAAKILGLMDGGVRVGAPAELRLAFVVFGFFLIGGVAMVIAGLSALG